MSQALRIEEVDVVAQRDSLTPILREYLRAHRNPGHYDWLYLDNPAGRGRAWIAVLDPGEAIVGVAAAFPRRMHVRGQELVCWNLGDFAIRSEQRSLGPAVALQRRCVSEVLGGTIPFAYDHPSRSMMAVYRWLKIEATGEVIRFAKPLRVDARVERVAGGGGVSRGLAGVGNVVLALGDRRRMRRAAFVVSELAGRFDERVLPLAESLARRFCVVGARTPDYLNWRYLDNPTARYDVLAVAGEQALRGYAILRRDEDSATVTDLVDDGDPAVGDALLGEVVERVRARAIPTLNVPVLEASPLAPVLERWGFKPRGSTPFVATTRAGGDLDGTVNRAPNWYHTDGDRDV